MLNKVYWTETSRVRRTYECIIHTRVHEDSTERGSTQFVKQYKLIESVIKRNYKINDTGRTLIVACRMPQQAANHSPAQQLSIHLSVFVSSIQIKAILRQARTLGKQFVTLRSPFVYTLRLFAAFQLYQIISYYLDWLFTNLFWKSAMLEANFYNWNSFVRRLPSYRKWCTSHNIRTHISVLVMFMNTVVLITYKRQTYFSHYITTLFISIHIFVNVHIFTDW